MIKKLLKTITDELRKQLQVAFEEGSGLLIELDPNIEIDGQMIGPKHFIGVHLQTSTDYVVTEQAGFWSYGELKK